MTNVGLRSPYERVDGLFYFGRMLDKIRSHEKCVTFLRINYDQLVKHVKQGGTDEEILRWCFTVGSRPSEDQIYVWNEFMRKRGWNDEVSETLKRRKQEAGIADRSDIQTAFQFIDADEGRLPKSNH